MILKTIFEYLEVRPCIDTGGDVESFRTIEAFEDWRAEGDTCAHCGAFVRDASYWSLYGIDQEGLAHCLGDFKTKEAAFEMHYAFLALMFRVRDLLDGNDEPLARQAYDDLCDFLAQSTNRDDW